MHESELFCQSTIAAITENDLSSCPNTRHNLTTVAATQLKLIECYNEAGDVLIDALFSHGILTITPQKNKVHELYSNLQMEKLRFQEVKQSAQNCSAQSRTGIQVFTTSVYSLTQYVTVPLKWILVR